MASAWGVSWGGSWGVSWGDSGVEPPLPPPARRGGGGSKTRRYVQRRIKTLREIVEAAKRARDDEKAAAARKEALLLADALGLAAPKLRAAETLPEVLSGLREITKRINSEIAKVDREAALSQKKHEQDIENANREQRLKGVIDAEMQRQAAERQDNEEIAIALLLIA